MLRPYLVHPVILALLLSGGRQTQHDSGITPGFYTQNPVTSSEQTIRWAQASKTHRLTISEDLVDSLTLTQQIGQLIMMAVSPTTDPERLQEYAHLIQTYAIGSIILFRGTLEEVYTTIQYLQARAPIPLLVAMDAEWGLAMRVPDGPRIPRALTLGAVDDLSLLRDMGYWTGVQLRILGIHWNLAPVVDVNTNPENPIIGWRSFGSDPHRIARQTLAFTEGMARAGVLACVKHFPGHGDTHEDSHLRLPVVHADSTTLWQVHLYPFRVHIYSGVPAIMVGHLAVPALDIPYLPASLSSHVMRGVLRNRLRFEGIILTDALNMGGVAPWGEQAPVLALQNGADLLVMPKDIPGTIQRVQKAIISGRIPRAQIRASVQRILRLKAQVMHWREDAGNGYPLPINQVRKILASPEARGLLWRTAASAITVLDTTETFPLREPYAWHWLIIAPDRYHAVLDSVFRLRRLSFTLYSWTPKAFRAVPANQRFVLVLIPPRDGLRAPRMHFGLSPGLRRALQRVLHTYRPPVMFWASPYFLRELAACAECPVVVGYEAREPFFSVALDVALGGRPARGTLPISIPGTPWQTGTGKHYSAIRLGFGIPEEVHLHRKVLTRMDSLIQTWIHQHIFPGAVLLIARHNQIVYWKAYGYMTYDSVQRVDRLAIFDLASITKILATTLAVMKLVEEGRLHLNGTVCQYLPESCAYPVGTVTIRELLTHTSGLPAWKPFFRQYTPDSLQMFFCEQNDSVFCIPVASGMFARHTIADSIYWQILRSRLRKRGRYRYSDLGFYLLGWIVERVTGVRLDTFVHRTFYAPLGLKATGFCPWQFAPISRVVPTEVDTYFRHTVIRGYVHDPGAALLGGVAGHAGLFSNAYEIAVLLQMLLQDGQYSGHHLLDASTIRQFTRYQNHRHRRALGFDKPAPAHTRWFSPACDRSSPLTFGHLGFTGVAVWADPATDLLFVFLANSTYPSMWEARMSKVGGRKKLHCLVYEALETGERAWQQFLSRFAVKEEP